MIVVATYPKNQEQQRLQHQRLANRPLFAAATKVSLFFLIFIFFITPTNHTKCLIRFYSSLVSPCSHPCNTAALYATISTAALRSHLHSPPPAIFRVRFTYAWLFIAFFNCFIICCCNDCYYCAVNCIHKQGKREWRRVKCAYREGVEMHAYACVLHLCMCVCVYV